MTKRALKIGEEKATKSSLVNTPSRSATAQVQSGSENAAADASDDQRQCFSTEDQALEFLVGNIVEKLGEGSQERAEMADFLNLLLDTDPHLREEILAGVTIRKDNH